MSKNYNPQQSGGQQNKTTRKSNKNTLMTGDILGNPIRLNLSQATWADGPFQSFILTLVDPCLNITTYIIHGGTLHA